MTLPWYILDDQHNPVPVTDTNDLVRWGQFLEQRDKCVVGKACVRGFVISTVFLGVDHSLRPGGEPILFETAVFPPDEAKLELGKANWSSSYMKRYATWAQAEAGHAKFVALIQQEMSTVDRITADVLSRIMSAKP